MEVAQLFARLGGLLGLGLGLGLGSGWEVAELVAKLGGLPGLGLALGLGLGVGVGLRSRAACRPKRTCRVGLHELELLQGQRDPNPNSDSKRTNAPAGPKSIAVK